MSYVKNAWYVAGWSHELTVDRLFGTFILSQPIVIWRNASGGLTALEDRCVHRLAPLSLGRCERERLRCMYHGILYDRSGHIAEIPGQELLPSSLALRSYPVLGVHATSSPQTTQRQERPCR
jgi:phenylpropionate dioxygenase-like ring-hydroxylating dioxygenase large terminal subunit